MIAEECRKLREQLEEVSRANERENIVQQLNSRREELVSLSEAVLSVTDSLKSLASRTSIVGTLDPAKAIERVAKIRASLAEDPQSITKGRDFSNMKKAFEKFAEDGGVAAKETWAAYLPKVRPKVDKGQIDQAENLKESAPIARKLKSLEANTRKLEKKTPANEEAFIELESAWEGIRLLIDDLPPLTNNPKVQEFLKEANAPAGASIDLLTGEVRDWLDENNIVEKYRITTM